MGAACASHSLSFPPSAYRLVFSASFFMSPEYNFFFSYIVIIIFVYFHQGQGKIRGSVLPSSNKWVSVAGKHEYLMLVVSGGATKKKCQEFCNECFTFPFISSLRMLTVITAFPCLILYWIVISRLKHRRFSILSNKWVVRSSHNGSSDNGISITINL